MELLPVFLFLFVPVIMIVSIFVPVLIFAPLRNVKRPIEVQTAKLADRFDGRVRVHVYPIMTALSRDQIFAIAHGKGYAFQFEVSVRGPYQSVMYFVRPVR